MRTLLLGVPATGSRPVDLGLLVLRLVGGLSLALAHGIGKLPPSERFVGRVAGMGFPLPEAFAWAAAFAEAGGGLLLALGLLTRPAALLVAGNFLVITLVANAGESYVGRESGVLFLMLGLTLLLAGPGRLSLDAALGRRRP